MRFSQAAFCTLAALAAYDLTQQASASPESEVSPAVSAGDLSPESVTLTTAPVASVSPAEPIAQEPFTAPTSTLDASASIAVPALPALEPDLAIQPTDLVEEAIDSAGTAAIAEPIAEPIAESTVELTAESATESTAESTVESIVEPTVESIVEPTVEPTSESIAESVPPNSTITPQPTATLPTPAAASSTNNPIETNATGIAPSESALETESALENTAVIPPPPAPAPIVAPERIDSSSDRFSTAETYNLRVLRATRAAQGQTQAQLEPQLEPQLETQVETIAQQRPVQPTPEDIPDDTEVLDLQQRLNSIQDLEPEFGDEFAGSPAITLSNPSGFGADRFTGYAGVSFQSSVRDVNGVDNDDADGSAVLGIGLGDAREAVGLQLSYTLASFGSNAREFGTGGFNAKLHRRFPSGTSVAFGWEGFATTGDDPVDFEDSLYGVITQIIRTTPNINAPLSRIALTAGVGNGRFRSESDFEEDEDSVNVFGSAALRIARPVSAVVEWTGQDLALGLSITPFRNIPLTITPALRDVAGAGDGARFVIGTGISFRF